MIFFSYPRDSWYHLGTGDSGTLVGWFFVGGRVFELFCLFIVDKPDSPPLRPVTIETSCCLLVTLIIAHSHETDMIVSLMFHGHSFNKHYLNTCPMPGIVLGTKRHTLISTYTPYVITENYPLCLVCSRIAYH